MPRLKAANNAETTLTQAIDAVATSFTVADASLFPDAPFRITIDAEIMEVGAIDRINNTFSSVQRALEGTEAAAHASGAKVENRFTAGTYGELVGQTDSATPSAHKSTHASGGSDALAPADIGAVNKAGDTMTGPLTINAPTTAYGTAKIKNNAVSGNNEASIGLYKNAALADADAWVMGVGVDASGDVFGIRQGAGIKFSIDTAGVVRIGGPSGYPVWHAGNDGAGSGLDADLLDGRHYSDIEQIAMLYGLVL